MNDHRIQVVPPGSSPCRELLRAVAEAITLPFPRTHADEVSYFRLRSQRASLAVQGIRRILASKDADSADMLTEASVLRELIADLPADIYEHSNL
jgi:hypothetical protein